MSVAQIKVLHFHEILHWYIHFSFNYFFPLNLSQVEMLLLRFWNNWLNVYAKKNSDQVFSQQPACLVHAVFTGLCEVTVVPRKYLFVAVTRSQKKLGMTNESLFVTAYTRLLVAPADKPQQKF